MPMDKSYFKKDCKDSINTFAIDQMSVWEEQSKKKAAS
jgi:hypothetical protein